MLIAINICDFGLILFDIRIAISEDIIICKLRPNLFGLRRQFCFEKYAPKPISSYFSSINLSLDPCSAKVALNSNI